ncbi:hypothetical protein DSO57_1006275 [Entomophthora muscae]|uniref:Uncharacterized protein n=1 Tax=Entomophthora muscae TaxID=34485 RepID=A0ACC2TVF0_9FUNG|nr:hypothetical protein DSO57_1006275 [Entomophthora muscae]
MFGRLTNYRLFVRINNFLPLESWAQEQDLSHDLEFLQAAGPKDQGAVCSHFSEAELPQAEAKNDCPKGEASQIKGIIPPHGKIIKAPNRGNKIPTICFISLKTVLVANQDVSSKKNIGPGPELMTATQEQENQVAN